MRDASIDGLIQKMISARMRESSEGCPDANTMAAYLEASLSPQEMAAFETHASECTSCQEVLALSMKLQDDAGIQTEEAHSARKKVLFHFAIPIPVLGGVIAAVILVAVLLRIGHDSGKNIQPPQSAELHAPARQAEIATRDFPLPPPVASKDSLIPEKPKLEAQLSENKSKESALPVPQAETESIHPAAPAVIEPAPAISAEIAPQKLAETAGQKMADKADKGAFPRGEESIARPSIYRASNRIAASDTLNMAPVSAASPRDAIIKLGDWLQRLDLSAQAGQIGESRLSPAQDEKKIASQDLARVRQTSRAAIEREESKKVGEKTFYLNSGYWIDRQCIEHQDDSMVEITSAAPEYEKILTQYPELRNLRPALIYWNSEIYLLR